jgi:hypothetical protein
MAERSSSSRKRSVAIARYLCPLQIALGISFPCVLYNPDRLLEVALFKIRSLGERPNASFALIRSTLQTPIRSASCVIEVRPSSNRLTAFHSQWTTMEVIAIASSAVIVTILLAVGVATRSHANLALGFTNSAVCKCSLLVLCVGFETGWL